MEELSNYTYQLEDIESQWDEENPQIIEAAKKMIDQGKLTPEQEEKMRQIHRQRGEEEVYTYETKQEYLFYKNLPELIRNYSGLYIWFEDGKVKDTDPDELTLCSRVIGSDTFRASKINAVYINQVPSLN